MADHVAVCIVGFRNPEDAVGCLAALETSTHADFEVIICENGGRAAYDALTAALPSSLAGGQGVRAVMAPRNLGYAGGVNVCLAQTPDADAWWILNPDTGPSPGAMAALIGRLAHGDCEAVGSTLHFPDGRVQSHGGLWRPWFARAVSIGFGEPLDRLPDPGAIEQRQNYLNGASMLIGRRFLEVVGPMREDYFLYCEEVEWCLRGRMRGLRLGFAAGAPVLHHQGTTTGHTTDFANRTRPATYLNERNSVLLTWDRFPGRMPVVALSALLGVVLRYPRRRAWRQFGYGLAGWFAGLRNERGPPRWMKT